MKFEEIEIQSGEFVLVCGKSAGGKTTLIKSLKSRWERQGLRVGYVMQDFDAQIVTDKVWHELSFALENLGERPERMHRRVAEVCSYFGITDWLEKDTALLSGGQKQLLNLASVMATTPQVLLLDEPTSQLDPISAQNFIHTVRKINEEFGITVVMSEHRLEELFPVCDRLLFVDNMQVALDGSPRELAQQQRLYDFLPLPARLALRAGAEPAAGVPLTIREGRLWLAGRLRGWTPEVHRESEASRGMSASEGGKTRPAEGNEAGQPQNKRKMEEIAIDCRRLSFCYEKNVPVLRDLSLQVGRGEIFAGVGANGSGKSTLLKLICGLKKPLAGRVRLAAEARAFLLPQNVKHIFTRRTVAEELEECGWQREAGTSLLDAGILQRHPYDISGGEMQKLALEKILLQKPDVILLDEPTKGLDKAFKREFAEILRGLAADGMTVLLTSHDLDFCASVADRVGMFFEGRLLGVDSPEAFFGGNNFYTTSVNKLTRASACGLVREEALFSWLAL